MSDCHWMEDAERVYEGVRRTLDRIRNWLDPDDLHDTEDE